jgi:hypothetical protein
MAYRDFPKLNGSFINLRELSVNDAKLITIFMSNNKSLNSSPYDNSIDQNKLQQFKEKAMSDLVGAWNAALAY